MVAVISISFAYELNMYLPTNSSGTVSTNSAIPTTTSWFGDLAPPAGCGTMTIRSSGWDMGYNVSVYVSSTNLPGVALLGSRVCIYTHLQNTKNASSSPPTAENLYVTNVNARNTSIYSGTIFFRGECAVPAPASESLRANGTGWNCNIVWDTSQPYNGILPNNAWPDVWEAKTTVNISDSATVLVTPGTFSFAPQPSTSTNWLGNGAPPSECGNSTIMSYSMVDGYRLEIYSPSQPVSAGGSLCIYTRLLNVDNTSTAFPTNETLMVTSSATPGFDYFQAVCFPSTNPVSFGAGALSWNCAAGWDTSQYAPPPANSAPPGAYQVLVVARLLNSSTVVTASSNINLVLSRGSSTTSNVNPASRFGCPGPFKLETPNQNSSLFLRVVTDNGSVINFNNLPNNGSIFVTHTNSKVPNYCLRLVNNDNSTGYAALVGNASLPAAGSYNMTIFAGYSNGPGYSGTIPTITVGPNSMVYVTISVPSGKVTIVDCRAGACSTSTSTATTLGGV